MDESEDDPFNYSAIEIPTVVGLLRNVLTQYPDSGQILKELVQNAEDAGGTIFEAVHDARNIRTDDGTFHRSKRFEEIQRFLEAPAFCVYNNAEFTDEDWHGIRMLSESIKKNDPLKVGQFGLGFKSIFHFTDFVTIISGKRVLFMDPNEPEAKMCRDLPLAKLSTFISEEECLHLWGTYLTREHLQAGHTPGTIFWFPLRREESQISSTVYEHTNVERLFTSFSVEAPLCLTFLKSLERICIKKMSDQNVISDNFCVNLCGAGLPEAQRKRKMFRMQLEDCKGFPDDTLTCSYNITVKTFDINQTSNQQNFRVLHFLAGTSEGQRGLHMPLVGIAAPMPLVREDSKGQIFCFLPLPLESVNNTNLPIQINGYFVLDQNRRHVKWRTEESSEGDVMWNENLVENVLADAYFLFLQDVLQEAIAGSCSARSWYSLLPHTVSTSGRWEELSRKIWTKLLQYPVLYSEVKKRMMKPGEVISSANLALLTHPIAESVRRVMNDLDLPLATVPENVVSTLCSIGAEPESVTPKHIRDCMRNNNLKDGWNQLPLLEYVMSDGQYEDLEGIPLLPLENGSWTRFSKGISPVYLCTADEAKALRGVEDRLLSISLPETISVHMQKIALTGVMQLQSFKSDMHTTELLPISVMYIQNNFLSHQDIEIWLQMVWPLLQNVGLQKIESLSILPSSGNLNPSSFISLSSAIIVRDSESQIPEAVFGALRLLGNEVIPKLPNYVRHHELPSYWNRADGQGIHRSLQKVLIRQNSNNLVSNFNQKVTDEQRKAFSNVISEVQSLNPNVKTFLQRLCLFKAVEKTSVTNVSVEKVSKLYPDICNFPVSSPEPLISSSDANIRQLALRLGATQLSKEDLCILALRKDYSEKDTKKLGWYVLNNGELHNSNNIQICLRSVRFIPTSSGKLCMASELYDPMDTDIDALLGEKDLTPDKSYRDYNRFLKCLGLKKVQDMPMKEMVRIVKGVQNMQLSECDRSIKIKAILKSIDQRSDCPQVCQEIRNVPCVYGESSSPTDYPKELQWATNNVLYTPASIKSYEFKDVVGSCVPLVYCDDVPNVVRSFGWNVEPSVNEIVDHLTNVVGVCPSVNGIPKSAYYEQLKTIYKNLNNVVGSPHEKALFSLAKLPFVFTGYGFKLPSQVYIPSGKEDLQLLPYMHSLPVELCVYTKLFCLLGSFEVQARQLYLQVLKQIQSQHNGSGDVDPEHDREVVVSLLQKLVKYKSEICSDQLLLPVETHKDRLELVDISHCAYSDQDCEWLCGDELDVKVVHKCVGNKLAKALGVEPLNKILLADEEGVMDEEDGLEWGQREPLTTRIHNLLRQYRDGVAVLKELVQNADDAGATQISFLYDARQNQDACKRLITDQLKECQGPALWAYNNAKFTDTDFENLRKLGGGTKEFLSTKIGKFGLGFCSVYNLTDVPSFVSGNNYVIFDPHETYLENNKRGGVRYNFSKKRNQIMLKKLDGQFKPFCNVFGCQIQETSSFDGTLFRLPFRTTEQASKSKISDQSYSHNEITDLLNMFREVVGEILLFMQNIKKVSVFYVGKSSAPQEMELLYESSRAEQKSLTISGDLCRNINHGSKQVESVAQLFNNHCWNGKVFHESSISDIKVVCTKKSSQLFNVKDGTWTVTWLTSWHSGTGESCRLAEKLGGKVLSLGAVAVPVEQKKNLWKPRKLKKLPCGFYKESHMHCFLPLPVKTSLPVQVNGFFEVATDRTSLMIRTEDDRSISKDWNSVLVNDAINAAYLNLIDTLRLEGLSQDALYFSLWPIPNQTTDDLMINLAECFYYTIKEKDLKVFRNKNGWYPLSRSRFLADSFYNVRDIGSLVFEFMGELLKKENMQVVELPEKLVVGFGKHISDTIINEECFYNLYFLPNLAHEYIVQEKQNKLILHIMDSQKPFLNKLKEIPCIPTLPNGKLKKPCDLIKPKSKLADLFSKADERFPIDTFMEGSRSSVLTTLGMRCSDLDDGMILERTKTVDEMLCLSCAVTRSSRILQYFEMNKKQMGVVANAIKGIPFIPVLSKPDGWCVKWEGDNCETKQSRACTAHANTCIDPLSFAAPATICSPELIRIAGSTLRIQGLVDRNKYEWSQKHVCAALGIITLEDEVPFMSVVSQLKEYSAKYEVMSPAVMKDVCAKIYQYLDNKVKQNSVDLSTIRDDNILLTKYGFVKPKLFAMDENIDCAPALFSAQREDLHCFEHLIRGLGIKEQFPPSTVFEMLQQKKREFQSETLPEEEVLLISKLLNLLFRVCKTNGKEQLSLNELCLPDAKSILRPVGELCIDDGANVGVGKFNYLHQNINYSQSMLKWLGIEEKTKKRYLELSHRIRFGQKEPLTIRLKNILENYPCDSGIMKELLQNADDAGATEIAFIKDFRNLPTEKLFDEKWAPLQGPAFCVYNNRCFNEIDLNGIQNLGDSCKIQDPASTGQYGIGFNAVYHLTDAPSFITRGKDVPGYETICMFDPHCMYDSQATIEYPGVQLTDLDYLRKAYPHSFEGYLEDMLKEEGTVFRLPLRTYEESKIGKVMRKWQLEELLDQFKSEMKICLLFLKNVRKISICSVGEDGELCNEYCVESHISEEKKVLQIKDIVYNRKEKSNVFELQYLLNMERVAYEVIIKDTDNSNYRWLIVQQFGSQNSGAVPERVMQAFIEKRLRLLPQAGVAILLEFSKNIDPSLFKIFCYLPLPVQSGMHLCVNGHFALDNSRRNLWTGTNDLKTAWNEWLLKEVLVPVTTEALSQFRLHVIPEGSNLSLEQYEKEIKVYYNVLPEGSRTTSDTWKNFVLWFYQYVKKQESRLFDVFITEDDTVVKSIIGSITSYFGGSSKSIKGRLTWHPLMESESMFPMYFGNDNEENAILGTLKRLGLKVGSQNVYQKLKEVKIQVDVLSDENVLKFLLSWTRNCGDKCRVDFCKVKDTPFLSVENVCKVFKYISTAENFHSRINLLPLMVTSDMLLNHFDEQNPVFCTRYADLLPNFNHEFLHGQLLDVVKELKLLKKDITVMKRFTLVDLAVKLPEVLSQEYKGQEVQLPLEGFNNSHLEGWIRHVWRFISDELKRKFKIQNSISIDCDWPKGKQYLCQTLGEWALYPMIFRESNYLIPIENACRVLDIKDEMPIIFHQLPVPHPYPSIIIPSRLQLPADLKDPVAVLDVLYRCREEIASLTVKNKKLDVTPLLEYLGTNCESLSLSHNKIRELKIFKDAAGHMCSLDKDFILPLTSAALLGSIQKLGVVRNVIVLKPAGSDKISNLYKYLNPSCALCTLDVFIKFILPNFSSLPESDHGELLSFLREELEKSKYIDKNKWSQKEREVVSVLEVTPFIMLNGELVTANKFYDPVQPVFAAMKPNNLPQKWAKYEWQYFLRLAGMIHELTGDMFVKFARSLSGKEKDVKFKSNVLVDYLTLNYEMLRSTLNVIKDIEFLVPGKDEKLQAIFPYFETNSGLISFSSSAPAEHTNLLWTTMSLLPRYANCLSRKKELNVCDEVPEEELFLHICNVTSTSQANDERIRVVMDSIYAHLHDKVQNCTFLERFDQKVPVVHLPEKGKFVTVDTVVEELIDEIEPYLYKAPKFYGRYFSLLERLGVCEKPNCDHYSQVLNKIHDRSQEEKLSPEESRCMVLALEYLSKNMIGLQKITTEVLYLPTKEEKLVNSAEMYVSDNQEYERAVRGTLDKPLFVGFGPLRIYGNDPEFVKSLPLRLKPKFLSDVVVECFNGDEFEEIESSKIQRLSSLIFSEVFQKGVLRLLNHYKLQSGSSLDETETQTVINKLKSVKVQAVEKICITLKLSGVEIGSRSRKYYWYKSCNVITLYISKCINEKFMLAGLGKLYQILLNISCPSTLHNIMGILSFIDEPHLIHEYLSENNIRDFGEQISGLELYQKDVGTYLQQEFVPLLDNEFCSFHEGEIVAMQKYLSGDVDSVDDVYIIVQVKCLVKSADNVMSDEYEVLTGNNENPCIIVKAHQLYKFVRKHMERPCQHNRKANENSHMVAIYPLNEEEFVEEELSEEEIMRTVRKQVKEIWDVVGESEKRHLLRRLYLKWHPDKNMHRAELCTRVMQYIQSLIRRLEKGETIPDDDDHTTSKGTPSDFYRDTFRPPSWSFNGSSSKRTNSGFYRSSFGSSRYSRSTPRSERTKMADRREARKWMKQAQHDCEKAGKQYDGSACWIVYMCHQAAEKALKAALYLEDCEQALEIHSGSLSHNLSAIMGYLTSGDVKTQDLKMLVREIENRVGPYNSMLYPTHLGPPCENFTEGDATFMLSKTEVLLQKISPRI